MRLLPKLTPCRSTNAHAFCLILTHFSVITQLDISSEIPCEFFILSYIFQLLTQFNSIEYMVKHQYQILG